MKNSTAHQLANHKLPLKILMLVILTLVGCQGVVKNERSGIALEQFFSLKSIKDYLSANLGNTGFGGKSHCAYEVFDAGADGKTNKIYLWVLCQEFYRVNQALEQGTGSSFPLELTVQRKDNEFHVISHRKPRDGAFYAEDMQVIFPEMVRDKIQSEPTGSYNNRVQKLQNEVKIEAGMS
jgi:hypothetical protein